MMWPPLSRKPYEFIGLLKQSWRNHFVYELIGFYSPEGPRLNPKQGNKREIPTCQNTREQALLQAYAKPCEDQEKKGQRGEGLETQAST